MVAQSSSQPEISDTPDTEIVDVLALKICRDLGVGRPN